MSLLQTIQTGTKVHLAT